MTGESRLRFPDGLRGIAALVVIMPHATGFYAFAHASALVLATRHAMEYGRSGVQIFFVVSGFVIAYTLRNARMTPRSVGNFILRRSVRLDPPYWTGIAMMFAFEAVRVVTTHKDAAWPSVPQVVAHLFYLQEVLGYPEINVAYWTLCIEFQFYLSFALLVAVAQAGAARAAIDPKRAVAIAGAILFLASLYWVALPIPWSPKYLHQHLHAFLAGALTCWTIDGAFSRRGWLCAAGLLAVCLAINPSVSLGVVLTTTIALYAAARAGRMSVWLAHPSLQYLGRISYSIYLVHIPISAALLGLRVRVAPGSNLAAFAFHAAVVGLSIAAAHVLHVAVEAPCIRLSKKLKRREDPERLPVLPLAESLPIPVQGDSGPP